MTSGVQPGRGYCCRGGGWIGQRTENQTIRRAQGCGPMPAQYYSMDRIHAHDPTAFSAAGPRPDGDGIHSAIDRAGVYRRMRYVLRGAFEHGDGQQYLPAITGRITVPAFDGRCGADRAPRGGDGVSFTQFYAARRWNRHQWSGVERWDSGGHVASYAAHSGDQSSGGMGTGRGGGDQGSVERLSQTVWLLLCARALHQQPCHLGGND